MLPTPFDHYFEIISIIYSFICILITLYHQHTTPNVGTVIKADRYAVYFGCMFNIISLLFLLISSSDISLLFAFIFFDLVALVGFAFNLILVYETVLNVKISKKACQGVDMPTTFIESPLFHTVLFTILFLSWITSIITLTVKNNYRFYSIYIATLLLLLTLMSMLLFWYYNKLNLVYEKARLKFSNYRNSKTITNFKTITENLSLAPTSPTLPISPLSPTLVIDGVVIIDQYDLPAPIEFAKNTNIASIDKNNLLPTINESINIELDNETLKGSLVEATTGKLENFNNFVSYIGFIIFVAVLVLLYFLCFYLILIEDVRVMGSRWSPLVAGIIYIGFFTGGVYYSRKAHIESLMPTKSTSENPIL